MKKNRQENPIEPNEELRARASEEETTQPSDGVPSSAPVAWKDDPAGELKSKAIFVVVAILVLWLSKYVGF